MAAKSPRWRRKGALIGAALIGGWLAGSVLRPDPPAPSGAPELRRPARAAERAAGTARPAMTERAGVAATPAAGEMVGFSRLQWSRLVRNPEALRIPLAEYLPRANPEEAVPVIDDIPLIGRLFQRRLAAGLLEAATLFGWDDAQTRNIAGILTKYGRAMAEAENAGASLEYLPEGGLRVDFSESQSSREAAVAQLRQALIEQLGARDADRFASVTQLEGLAGPLPTAHTITANVRNGLVLVSSDSGEWIMPNPLESHLESSLISLLAEAPLTVRLRHLKLEIDWARVLADAEAAGRTGE